MLARDWVNLALDHWRTSNSSSYRALLLRLRVADCVAFEYTPMAWVFLVGRMLLSAFEVGECRR